MIRGHGHKGKRSAFTLVELLVVILIIAILVSLVSSAVMMAMNKIPEVQTRTEISELAVALEAFKSDYNLSEAPPSLLLLNEAAPTVPSLLDGGRTAQFLQKVFGKNLLPTDWNGDGTITPTPPGTPTWTLQGQQCLTFYLGGIPGVGGPQGFSTNNMKPSFGSMPALGETPGKRKGPYFTFVTSRLVPVAATGGFYVYTDPWQVKTSTNGIGPMPYAYFSSYSINNGYTVTDCNGLAYTDALGAHFAMPYWTAQNAAGVPTQYTNGNTYQILSAGRDGKFGYNPAFLPAPNNLWIPASGAVGTGADDQANFSGSLLGSGQS